MRSGMDLVRYTRCRAGERIVRWNYLLMYDKIAENETESRKCYAGSNL